MPRRSHKKKDLSLLIGILLIVFLVNVINQSFFFRLDLTSEKRYTLSEESKDFLRGLEDIVFVRVYLDGELNIPFRKFRQSIQDMLDEFRIYGKSNLHYEFENPFENALPVDQNKIIEDLYNRGLAPSNIHSRDNEAGVSEKIVFPGAIISYKDYEMPVNLLQNKRGQNADQNLNSSMESLEYNLISTIKNLTASEISKIAFIEGHGELAEPQVNDISKELSKTFQIDRGIIGGNPGILDEYKVIIVADPTEAFSEQDKFVIDQYIMQGGRVLWVLDAIEASLDSLIGGETMAFIRELNLEDQLFRYGVRINPELIQDIQCSFLPVNVALAGNAPNFQLAPWFYYPLLNPNPEHPICQNLNVVQGKFVCPVDTPGIRPDMEKTVLLSTSPYCKTRQVPALISLSETSKEPNINEFSGPELIAGILLEGSFESAFTNRPLDAYFEDPPSFTERSVKTRMAVLSDGDLIRNEVRFSGGRPVIDPLGYDRYTEQTYANKDLIANLIQYLAGDDNLLALRGRTFKLRLLDKERVNSERTKWVLLNMLFPSLIVLLFGAGYLYYRKRRYSK